MGGGRRKKADENDGEAKPKRSLTGYQLFMKEQREIGDKEMALAVAQIMSGSTKTSIPTNSTATNTAKWKKMSEEEKKPYQDKAKDLKEEYTKQLKEWEKKYPEKVEAEKQEKKERKEAKKEEEGKHGKRRTKQTIQKLLRKFGIDTKKSSNCIMEGIRNGTFACKTKEDLKKNIYSDTCDYCGKETSVTLEEALKQGDYGGDYESGSEGGCLMSCGCRAYISQGCWGNPTMDCGKFHNHCTQGSCGKNGFGQCIGDYREAHCDGCGEHYYGSLSGFACPTCGGSDEDGEEGGRAPRCICM